MGPAWRGGGGRVGQHHGPWWIPESGVTNQKAEGKAVGGGVLRPKQGAGRQGGVQLFQQQSLRAHTVDTSVPLPLWTEHRKLGRGPKGLQRPPP